MKVAIIKCNQELVVLTGNTRMQADRKFFQCIRTNQYIENSIDYSWLPQRALEFKDVEVYQEKSKDDFFKHKFYK